MYKVFKTEYHKDGKIMIKGKEVDNFRVEFIFVGEAKSFSDAKKKFKIKHPVLEEIVPTIYPTETYH